MSSESFTLVTLLDFSFPSFSGSLPLQKAGQQCNEMSMAKNHVPTVPCAALLVRVKVIEKDQKNTDNTIKIHNLDEYDSSPCEPLSGSETICRAAKLFEVHRQQQLSKQKKEQTVLSLYNSQFISILESINLALLSNKNAAKKHLSRPLEVDTDGEKISTYMQQWLDSFLPPCHTMKTTDLLDYSYLSPYNKEAGIAVCVNQLYNMTIPKKKGLLSAFSSTPSTLYKVIYSIYPGCQYYTDIQKNLQKNKTNSNSAPWGIKFTEQMELNSHSKSPIFRDTPQLFYPNNMNLLYNDNKNNMNNDIFLVLDVRTVPACTKNKNSNIDSTDLKSYWAILPLSKENRELSTGKRKCHRFVNTGTFQLPLFEGPFPYNFMLEKMSKSSEENSVSLLDSILMRLEKNEVANNETGENGV